MVIPVRNYHQIGAPTKLGDAPYTPKPQIIGSMDGDEMIGTSEFISQKNPGKNLVVFCWWLNNPFQKYKLIIVK